MNKKGHAFIIKLSSSEALVFSGCFGLFFAVSNFYQIFLEKVFPIIIENSTSSKEIIKLLYIIMLILVSYESIAWIIQLADKMQKTRRLNVNYTGYMLKIIIFGILGCGIALILNKWLYL